MKVNSILSVIFISIAYSQLVHAKNDIGSINDVENVNVAIHKLEIDSEKNKAKIILNATKEQLEQAEKDARVDRAVNNNNNKIKSMESEYNLTLNKYIYGIKMGTMDIDEIPEGFMKKKVYSKLLSTKNKVEKMLEEIADFKKAVENKDNVILSKNKDIRALETKVLETIKKYQKERIDLIKSHQNKISNITKNYNHTISGLKSKIKELNHAEQHKEEVDPVVMEVPVDKKIEILSIDVSRVSELGEYKKVVLSFAYILPYVSDKSQTFRKFTLVKSKRLIIPEYGNLIVDFHGERNIGFYNSTKLIKTISYR